LVSQNYQTMLKSKLFFIIALFAVNALFAVPSASVKQFQKNTDWSFVENNGQLKAGDIKYYTHNKGVEVYCRPGKISFVFTVPDCDHSKICEATGRPAQIDQQGTEAENPLVSGLISNRFDLVLFHSNQAASIEGSSQQLYYENFYTTGDANRGILNVHTFKTVTYKNIYPNIDMVLHASPASAKATAGESGMKYEFVIWPGGKVSDIQLEWNGAKKMECMADGGIYYASAWVGMKETKPLSFDSNGILVPSRFIKKMNSVQFRVGKYDHSKSLIIDPFLEWSTYFGGPLAEYNSGITLDAAGNVLITGYTLSTAGIASSGAFQTKINGVSDAYVSKFSSSGSLLWSTYYGGNSTDFPKGIVTDGNSNIYLSGYTYSSSGIASSGSYQTSFGGVIDAFIAKFSASGSLVWSTFFGGKNDDEANGIAIDGSGNIAITGLTKSDSGIASSAAYQSSYSGFNDVFIAKFTGNGNLIWSTYFGGANDEEGNGVAFNGLGDILITGNTSSTGLASSGANQTSPNGGNDAFVAAYSSSGVLKWCTYFGGNSTDFGWSIGADNTGDIVIAGSTNSLSGLSTAGVYQTGFAAGGDAFIAKFTSSGALKWSTYFGGSGTDVINSLNIGRYGNINVVGTTFSPNGIAGFGAYQKNIRNGNDDAFVARFTSAGKFVWSSYFGGPGSDEGLGIVEDKAGNIFISGQTNSSTGIAIPGPLNNKFAGVEDAFVAFFNFKYFANDAGINNINSPGSTFCEGNYHVTVQLGNFGSADLDSVRIGWMVNHKIQPIYKWKGNLKQDSVIIVTIGNYNFNTGNDTIIAWTLKPNGQTDSLTLNDTAAPLTGNALLAPTPDAGGNHSICNGDTIVIGSGSIAGYAYVWRSKPQGFKSNAAEPLVSPSVTTIYNLMEVVISTGCSNTDSAVITVTPVIPLDAGKDQSICPGKSASIGAAPTGGITYSWTSNPSGFSSTSSVVTVSPSVTTTYYLKGSSTNTSCNRNDSVTINVWPAPDAKFFTDTTGNLTYLHAEDSSFKDQYYHWNFGDGDSSTGHLVKHLFAKNSPYLVKLSVTDTNGCANHFQSIVNVLVSGIETGKLENDHFDLYPNPFNNVTEMHYELSNLSAVKLIVMDVAGRPLYKLTDEMQIPGMHVLILDADQLHLNSGIYIVKFIVNDHCSTRRILRL